MNAEIRAKLDKVINQLQNLANEVKEIIDGEQSKYDNLPEGLQTGEQGSKLEEAIWYLQDAHSEVESSISNIESAQSV